jgi:regulator of protease activity HflC (stomatin/prohibitin superfamily)
MFFLTLLFFLALAYGIASFAIPKVNATFPKLKGGTTALIVGILGFVVTSLLVKIGPQEVGVVNTPTGVSLKPIKTGWHFIPWWNNVHELDKTVWVYTFAQNMKEGQKTETDAIWAPTHDGIKLGYDVTITWKIDEDQSPWIYKNISGLDGSDEARYAWIEENIIRAYSKSCLTSVTKNYTTIDAYSNKRDEIQAKTFILLKKECYANARVTIEAVNIREVHYNKDFERAINNKKLAEQEALRLVDVTRQKEEMLKQASINKDIAIQQAEGEAKSLQIKGDAIRNNPGIVQLNWIEKWDGALPYYMAGNGQGMILNMPNK